MKRLVVLSIAVFFTVFSYAQDAAEKINQGNEALKAQDYAKAYKLYDDAMKNLGDVQVDASINYNIGFAAYKSGNYDGAIKYFDKAIENKVNVSKCNEYKALVYNDKKDYKNAVASFEKAAATAEEGGDALIFNAAIAAYKGNMLSKAVELFGKAEDMGYKPETALYYKAVVLKKQGKDDEYKATLEKGVKNYPTDEKIKSALANIYVSEGNDLYKKGATILSTANKKINKGSLKTTDAAYTAEVDKSKVQFKAAVEVLQKALDIDSSNANAKKLMEACKGAL